MEVQLVLAVVVILAMLFTKLNQRLPKPEDQRNTEGQIKGLFQLIQKQHPLFLGIPWDYYIGNA